MLWQLAHAPGRPPWSAFDSLLASANTDPPNGVPARNLLLAMRSVTPRQPMWTGAPDPVSPDWLDLSSSGGSGSAVPGSLASVSGYPTSGPLVGLFSLVPSFAPSTAGATETDPLWAPNGISTSSSLSAVPCAGDPADSLPPLTLSSSSGSTASLKPKHCDGVPRSSTTAADEDTPPLWPAVASSSAVPVCVRQSHDEMSGRASTSGCTSIHSVSGINSILGDPVLPQLLRQGHKMRMLAARRSKKPQSTMAACAAYVGHIGQGNGPYICLVAGCGKTFKRSEHVKRHIRCVHMRERRRSLSVHKLG